MTRRRLRLGLAVMGMVIALFMVGGLFGMLAFFYFTCIAVADAIPPTGGAR